MHAQAFERVAHGPQIGATGVDDGHTLAGPAHSTPFVLGNPSPSRRIASPSARATALKQASTWWWSFSPRTRRCRVMPAASHSRSEEHTSELQSLMPPSYSVFCLKKTN